MTDKKTAIMSIFLCLALVGCATAGKGGDPQAVAAVEARILAGVEIADYEVRLRSGGEFTSPYTVYKPGDPYLVVVDIPGLDVSGVLGTKPSQKKGVSEVTVKQEDGLARVELLLEAPSDVSASVSGDALVLSVARPAAEEAPVEVSVEEEPAPAPAEEPAPAAVITDIGFSRSDNTLKLVIAGDGALSPNVFRLDNRVVIDVPGVEMKAKLPATMVLPVKFMRHGMYEGRVRIVVGIEEGREFFASTLNNSIVIDMPLLEGEVPAEAVEAPAEAAEAPAMKAEAEPAPAPAAGGECTKRISLDFQDANVVPIFRFIGEICGYNVVIHPSVSGTVNLKLMGVPANQALDIILELTNLGKAFREEGRILTVAPHDIFTRQKEEEAKLKQASMKVESLVEESFRLGYINATELLDIITKKKLMSARGQSYIDEVTNTLDVIDTEDSIRDIRKLVPKYDDPAHGTMQYGPMAQIMIEAKMVQVSTDYSRALGIRWGGSGDQDDFSFVDDASAIDVSVNTPTQTAGSSASAEGGIISIGYTETVQVNLSLEALESVGKTRSLANPRVLSLNKQSASIQQGVQIPYTVIEDGTAKTEFQSATLSLTVTPEIKPNDFIELQVTATNDTPTTVGSQIGVNTQSVSTKARVKNGETLVLGGIYTSTESEGESRVPVLGDIPVLGWLFKTRTVSDSPKELLIFITPNIVRQGT